MNNASVGPLLHRLLDTQAEDEAAVAYPQIETNARDLLAFAATFERPVVLAVGQAAQRLLAVADHIGRGQLETPLWTQNVRDRQVILVGTVTQSLIEFDIQATALKRQGAAAVHGCAIALPEGSSSTTLDSFTRLARVGIRARRSA